MNKKFLPISKNDLEERGWEDVDIILVTGDAYVDHPSYAAAVIGRVLENAGFRVGIIAEPDWRKPDDFLKLGRPRLFFGVTAGNLDSMVANYTANKKLRNEDDYSPGGKPGLRPDRAILIYTNKIKELFPGAAVVLGGIEASLRRLAHYDYWSGKVRRSLLLDSKADILVYGMGEKQVLEIAGRMRQGENIREMDDVRGTVIIKNSIEGLKDHVEIPSFEKVSSDKNAFNEAFKLIYLEADPVKGRTIVEKHGERFVVALPPAYPMTQQELDGVYELDYARSWHPKYDKAGGVPGFETVRHSIVSHRGCSGGCNFCSLYFHQGRIIQSRSADSIIKEAEGLAKREDFRGTITDIGGPTANLYKAECAMWKTGGACSDKKCLIPQKCKNLKLGYSDAMDLWKKLKEIPGVKHVFVGSGVRYDLLVEKYSDAYLKALCADHISGQLKVAPEHVSAPVLEAMGKPSAGDYEKFVKRFDKINTALNKKQYLVNYFLSGHPGAGLEQAAELAMYLAKKRIHPEQVQDYLPLPMTYSSAVYYTGKDPFTGIEVYVAKDLRERKLQRALIQYKQPANKKYIIEALKKLKRLDLIKFFLPYR